MGIGFTSGQYKSNFAIRQNAMRLTKAPTAYDRELLNGFLLENPKNEFALMRWKAIPRAGSGTSIPTGAARQGRHPLNRT